MLPQSRQRILDRLEDSHTVLDVGGWADPFPRADWVLDLMPYATRGLYEREGWIEGREEEPERFSEGTWVQRDICDRTPWPFEDDQFDFAICSHTLEDVRDPVWVCSELARVARAGYIEVPSRLEEQSWGVAGPFVGWAHHHWLTDIEPPDSIQFVFKIHAIHANPDTFFPEGFAASLTPEERVSMLWWEGTFRAVERVFTDSSIDEYLAAVVAGRRSLRERASRRLRRAGS